MTNNNDFDIENVFDSSFLDQITSDLIKDTFEQSGKVKNSVTGLTNRILNYLREKIENGCHEIKYSKFYDYLISIGCDAEDILEGFEFLEFTYDDYLNLTELDNYLSSTELKTKRYSIEHYLKKLRLTTLLPGFIDAYVDENVPNSYESLHQKLFKFLISHRLPSNLINPKKIDHQINNLNLRRKYLILQEDKHEFNDGLSTQVILKTEQCIKTITSCCSQHKITNLLDNQSNTCWESKNSECESHWILIQLKENISALRLYLTFHLTKDDGFKSHYIEISVAEDVNKTYHLISTCKIQTSSSTSVMLESESTSGSTTTTTNNNQLNGTSSAFASAQSTSSNNLFATSTNEFLLCDLFPKNQNYSFIKISIKATTSAVIRVKSIRLLGVKKSENKQQTVKDASICWFFNLLSSMVLMQSHIMPTMFINLVNVSKAALSDIPPLSLAASNNDSFLTEPVLTKVDAFLRTLINLPHHNKQECSQAVMIYLEFNLARGFLKNILYSLNWILENVNLNYDFRDLIPKLDTVSESCVRKTADHLKLTIIHADGMPSEKNANKPNFLLESNTNQQIYMTDAGVKRFNLILKSDKYVTITSLFMKIQRGNVGIKSFLLFFILHDKEPNVNDFNKFNNFTKIDYENYQNNNNDEDNKKFKMVYFEFLDKQTEAEFELPLVYRVKYILIKFLRPKELVAERLGVMHLKFNGCTYDNVDIYNQFSVIKYASSLNPHSGAMLVCAILWFLCQLVEKHKTLSRMQRESPLFINFDDFEINDLWKLYETVLSETDKHKQQSPSQHQQHTKIHCLRIPVLCLLYELVNCVEIKMLNYTFNSNRKVLDYLINLINSESIENDHDEELKHIRIISKHILLSGIDVFFPTFELRKQCLMLMLELNLSDTNANEITKLEKNKNFTDYLANITNKKSSILLFEAFCNLFYNAKASLLVDLNIKSLLNYTINDADSTKKMQENFNLISKVIELSLNPINKENINEKYTIINKLLNKIQSYICYKCRKLLLYLAKPNEQLGFGDSDDQEFIKQNDLAANLKLKKRLKSSVELFLINYTKLLINKIDLFLNKSDSFSLISYLNTEKFLILILHHYILWLIELVGVFSIKTCTIMLNLILNIEKLLNRINFIENINNTDDTTSSTVSQASTDSTDENLLRVWFIDTKTYSTLNNLSLDFNCIGASRYHIMFDDLCEIKNNIDLFEFIDSDDEHHTCNGYKVGCDSWKKELNIISHNYLKFNLITQKTIVPLEENINIKFTCRAYGYTYNNNNLNENSQSGATQTTTTTSNRHVTNSINDLRTSITCLVGIYCSHIYTQRLNKFEKNAALKTKAKVQEVESAANSNDDEKGEEAKDQDNIQSDGATTETVNNTATEDNDSNLESNKIENYYYFDLNSYLYKTLLRGGLLETQAPNKLIRSYSGIHQSIGMNDKMNKFLNEIIENKNNSTFVTEFLKLYETNYEKVKRPKIGGLRVNKAILAIFAALIWHTPVIKRNDLVNDEDEDEGEISKTINEHIAQAYKAAESTRMIIVEQQQLNKLAGAFNSDENSKEANDSEDEDENYEDFIDMVTKKAIYLLKVSRLSKIPMKNELYNDYEDPDKSNFISKSRLKKQHPHHHHHQHNQSLNKNSTATHATITSNSTPSVRLPKYDAYPTFNLILEFIFDKLINLKLITNILNLKKQNAKSISEAFKIAKEYLEVNLDQNQNETASAAITSYKTQQLECVLTFLSCFFNLKPQQYGIHYLQNLYGCGLNLEKLVREAYYEFLKLIFNFIKTYQIKHENGTITPYELDIYIRLNSYLLHFFNIDWELYDWKFILDIKLETFLIKNCYLNLSLTKHEYDAKDLNSKKPIEILENIFDIHDKSETNDTETEGLNLNVNNDENSFDLEIYPKLYKQYFGIQPSTSAASIGSIPANKRLNTDELIDCLSREASNSEQKIKFHIARYMAWKYFYKLKVNFTCDICDILLVGNRYQCIDCRDFSMCFNCFAKSCVDFNTTYTKIKSDDDDKSSSKKENEQHKPEHRVLLLDHCCDNCGALIVGKRIHCEQCEDYDLCLMCHKTLNNKTEKNHETTAVHLDDNEIDDESELNTSHCQQEHNKSHKFIIIEPNIYHGKSLKNTNLQLYCYLHSQILFSILTLKLSRLLAYSAGANSQEKASLMINDDLVYYKDINLLHSNCIRLIINCLNHIFSPKLFSPSPANKQKLELYSTYQQEILMGLLTTIIQSNTTNLVDNTIKFSILEIVSSFNENNNDDQTEHVFTIYELIAYLITIIIKRNDHYYEENLIYMVINALVKLLEYTEPHKIDLIMYYLNNINDLSHITENLEFEIENRIKTEKNYSIEGEFTLDYMIDWINQGVQYAQIDLIYNYIKLICKLCLNKNWKPAVDSLISRLLDSLLEINYNLNGNKQVYGENEQKILNFLCALIFTPVIVYVGQWIEYKPDDDSSNSSSSHNDGSSQQNEFRNALLKYQCYDESNKGFNLAIIDLITRNYVYLKGLQNDLNFRKSVNIPQFDTLQLTLDSCSKLIKLYKKLLAFNAQVSINSPNPSVVKYSNLKQLTLKHNLILLCITILLKEYQSKYADYLQKQKNDDSGVGSSLNLNFYFENDEDEETLKKLFIDYDFIRLVSEIAHLGTSMDSDWQLQHLQTYLFRLLMKEGFNNLSDETSGDECENDGVEVVTENTATNKKSNKKSSKDDQKQQQQQQQQLANRIDKGLESIDIKTKINFIDRLKLDLNSYAVIGIDDTLNNYLCDNQDKQDNKLNKRIYNRRIRKSFKLLKEATDKMIARSNTYPSDLSQLGKNEPTSSPSKTLVAKSSNQNNTNTSSMSVDSSNLSITMPLTTSGIIKQVNIASLILNSRELLIFLVNNWPKNSETITASHLNCKNETDIIEFLYLLYNSIDINKYKLIVYNIVSLLDVSSLTKLCLLASNYLLPDYRFLKAVDWKSDWKPDWKSESGGGDFGELKRISITKNNASSSKNRWAIIRDGSEDNIAGGGGASGSGGSGVDGTETPNLPLANLNSNYSDYTLLIVFDLEKLKINGPSEEANLSKNKKTKQKYKAFKKQLNLTLKTKEANDEQNGNINDNEIDSDNDETNNDANEENKNNDLDNDEHEKNKNDSENDDDEDDDGDDDDDDDDDDDADSYRKHKKKSKKKMDSITNVLFFVGESRHSNETDDEEDEDEDENEDRDDDDDDDNDDDDDDDDNDDDNESFGSVSSSIDSFISNEEDYLKQVDSHNYVNLEEDNDMNDNERRRRKFKLRVKLHSIRDPYISIKNRSLKWKFIRGENTEGEQCTFKIYSCTTQTFDSAFILLNEIFANKSMNDLPLNELWLQLVKVACLITHTKRLKIINLLIKIIEHILQSSIQQYPVNYLDLFALKPLRSLLCFLALYKEDDDSDSLRALYELLFYAEKLVIKWSIYNEYTARLKTKKELIHRFVDVAIKVGLIEKAINKNNIAVDDDNPKNEENNEVNDESKKPNDNSDNETVNTN